MPSAFIGIDPGQHGGIALITPRAIEAWAMPETERDVWGLLRHCEAQPDDREVHALIEQQIPRPTFIPGKDGGEPRSSVLKSTCLLWGSYAALRMALVGNGIAFEEVAPRTWQAGLSITPRHKGESDNAWKGRLKSTAQALFPKIKVTLAVADALLIAEWCRRRHQPQALTLFP